MHSGTAWLRPGPVLLLAAAAVSAGGAVAEAQQPLAIPKGAPLHVTTTRSVPLRMGERVEGVLTEPVWVYDREVLARGALVEGVVTDLAPAEPGVRTRARLNGDLTPEHLPVVTFDRVRSGQTVLSLRSTAEQRQTTLVRFVAQPKNTARRRLTSMVSDRVSSVKETVFGPDKGQRALRFFYSQLPYHPQRIWKGTQFVADLDAPVMVARGPRPIAHVQDVALTSGLPPDAIVKARLITALDSQSARHGDPVVALLTQPLFDEHQNLLLPEGTELDGEVLRAKAARSFARNGQLQFTFRGIRPPGQQAEKMRGTVTGAEGSKNENLSVDGEGDVKAQPDKNRFVAPLLLGLLAAHGQDDDGGAGTQVVAANGFGLVARVVALTAASPAVATGFGAYGFAKSVYFRFIARGHTVTFPKDTQLEVQLSSR